MNTRLLLIGNTSDPGQVGAILLRAAIHLNCDIEVVDNNLYGYAPSITHVLGKIFFKMSEKKTIGMVVI